MNKKLKVFITGASSGIGAAMAQLFVQAGAQVAITGRRKDRLDEAAIKLAQLGPGSAYAYELDIIDSVATQRVLEQFTEEVGGLDVLINNAGIGFWGPAMQANLTDWNAMLDVNLRGLMTITPSLPSPVCFGTSWCRGYCVYQLHRGPEGSGRCRQRLRGNEARAWSIL